MDQKYQLFSDVLVVWKMAQNFEICAWCYGFSIRVFTGY